MKHDLFFKEGVDVKKFMLRVTLGLLVAFMVGCQSSPGPIAVSPTPVLSPSPTEDIRPGVIQAVFETQTAVAQPISATQAAEAQSLSVTRTAEAEQFAGELNTVATQAARSAKTEIAVQIAAALTALVPTPTPSNTPTITPIPTATPTPTATFTPGLHFVTLRWEPANPYTGDTIVFIVQFYNAVSVLQQIRWRVEIMDMDNNPTWTKLFFVTQPLVTDVNPGRYEFRAEPPWRIAVSSGKRNFMLHVVELDVSNRVVRVLSTPSGQVDFPLSLVPRGN